MQLETVIDIQHTSVLIISVVIFFAVFLEDEAEWFKFIGGFSLLLGFIIFIVSTLARIWM